MAFVDDDSLYRSAEAIRRIARTDVRPHVASLAPACRGGALAFASAQGMTTGVAMAPDDVVSDFLTCRERPLRARGRPKSLATVDAVCGLGVVASVGVASARFSRQAWAAAPLCGALVGLVWNDLARRAFAGKRQ